MSDGIHECGVIQSGSNHDGLEGRGALYGERRWVEVRFVEKESLTAESSYKSSTARQIVTKSR